MRVLALLMPFAPLSHIGAVTPVMSINAFESAPLSAERSKYRMLPSFTFVASLITMLCDWFTVF